MKKIIICLVLILAIVGVAVGFCVKEEPTENAAYLRIHIRADSNADDAQAVKYKVRDSVVAYLTPTVADCATKEQAMQKIEESIPEIERVATSVLQQNGFSYGAKASIRQEDFPTRVYESLTLEAGVYDALILELGSGKGDNWWCVVYPPLCFAGGNGNVIYKSKIAEIIQSFLKGVQQ